MTKEKTQLLADLLTEFFAEDPLNVPNALTRNPIASLLKKNLFDLGYWRNKGRNKSPKLSSQMFAKRFLEKNKGDLRNDCPF